MDFLFLLVGWACILFFGFGLFILLFKKDFKNSIISLGFVILGIWIINIEEEETVTSGNSEIPVETNVQIINKPATNNITTPKKSPTITSEEKFNEQANQLATFTQKVVDDNFTFDTSIKEIKLNEHIGTDSADDFIALIYLSYDQLHTEETTKKWIETYTSHLAASLATNTLDISELVIFWETPRFKENWNTVEFTLIKKDDGLFYFESETFDNTVFN